MIIDTEKYRKLIKHMREEAQDYRSGKTLGRAFVDAEDVLDEAADAIGDLLAALTPPNEWVRVDERLPENDGWYLVYAPEYWGHSKIYGLDGLAYSNFKHNYKVHWGIERGTGRGYPGIVTHWMPLPAPPEKEGDR